MSEQRKFFVHDVLGCSLYGGLSLLLAGSVPERLVTQFHFLLGELCLNTHGFCQPACLSSFSSSGPSFPALIWDWTVTLHRARWTNTGKLGGDIFVCFFVAVIKHTLTKINLRQQRIYFSLHPVTIHN